MTDLNQLTGEALAAAVATECMGWRKGRLDYRRWYKPRPPGDPDHPKPQVDVDTFRPDRDWNKAMAAAEKCGLFQDDSGEGTSFYLAKDAGEWGIVQCCDDGGERVVEADPSGPTAICRACLWLVRQRKECGDE